MNYKRFLGTASAALMIIVVVILVSAPGAWARSKYKTLYKFTGGTDGNGPSGLVFDSAGNLYGTAAVGGAFSYGTVFKLDTGGTMTVLYNFTGGADGAIPHPYGNLVVDGLGNLYGTTYEGGVYGGGTVFKLDTTGVETVLYSFCPDGSCSDGSRPTGGLIFDQAGNLYGTTTRGGNGSGLGVLFKLTPNPDGSWSETVLHSFGAYQGDAEEPYGGLVQDIAGNLYGATWQGGAYYQGTLFKLDTTGVETVLYNFSGEDGAHLYKPPIFDAAGNVYDTTAFGGDYSCPSPLGDGCGTVFKLDASGNITVLHTFSGGKDGAFPVGGLIFDQVGNLYGTAQFGGAYGYGVVFKLTLGQNGKVRWKVLHAFADRPGAEPLASLILDAAGNLYGTTYGDKKKTFGSVFEITP
jgi:uncharacterized repeat protein (TIGR03803 family)